MYKEKKLINFLDYLGMMKIRVVVWVVVCILFCGLSLPVNSQVKSNATPKKEVQKPAVKSNFDKLLIDSLEMELEGLNAKFVNVDSLYKAEKFTTAELRDQVIKLDDYRLKLEETINSFKGENLKLNQSNRILIVFNSMVAVLLVVSLVFFLKKIGRKNKNEKSSQPDNEISYKASAGTMLSLEEKLQQLERLGKLKEKGLLSESEFVNEKQQILGK